MTSSIRPNEISYWIVTGPGQKVLGNFWEKTEAKAFQTKVLKARLDQLERIKPALTKGEYTGELLFRTNSICVSKRTLHMTTSEDISKLSEEDLVDGNFLIC